jgi:arylsulfatase A-like enzyme
MGIMKMPVLRLPRGLLLAFGLSLAFMLFSYAGLVSDSQSAVFDHAAYKAVFDRPILGTALAGHITWFVTGLTLLHLGLGAWCWLLARSTEMVMPQKSLEVRRLVGLWFIITLLWLLAWNSGHYPRSSVGKFYAGPVGIPLLGLRVHDWLTLVYAAVTAWFLLTAATRRARELPQRRVAIIAGVVAVPVAALAAMSLWPASKVAAAPDDKPNIILLGIDSLRYDEVVRPGEASTTPNVDAFLSGAVRFDNALTPLARTYPSWVSLLTGKHPHTTGAFLNLLPDEDVHLGKTLPVLLREHGYHTAYAIDEVRFSNIDASYGFDQTVTPPIGSADFIVGSMSDTPLLNLVGNTRVGKWFFPHGHANRGTHLIYEPETFVSRVKNDIDYSAPMFLATHLTLPHWPYLWRDLAPPVESDSLRPGFYRAAVRRADAQFGEIFAHLQARGLLENAIVVVFSDHGETFDARADSLAPAESPGLERLRALPSWGHGTSVVTPHQYRIVLGVRGFGKARELIAGGGRVSHVAASIEDVTPTVLDMLQLDSQEQRDGMSLLAELRTPGALSEGNSHRVRFTETEFNPLNLVDMTGDFTVVNAKSLADATHYYSVDPDTDRIHMKQQFLDSLLRNRQFAAIGWSKTLGVFPSPETRAFSFLVFDADRGEPLPLDGADDFGKDAEIDTMWNQLCRRFGAIVDAGTQSVKCSANRVAVSTPSAR